MIRMVRIIQKLSMNYWQQSITNSNNKELSTMFVRLPIIKVLVKINWYKLHLIKNAEEAWNIKKHIERRTPYKNRHDA